MTTMIVELYEALRAAGAPEDKAQAAAKALADHERRLRPRRYRTRRHPCRDQAVRAEVKAVEGQVIMVKWITGATFAFSSTIRTATSSRSTRLRPDANGLLPLPLVPVPATFPEAIWGRYTGLESSSAGCSRAWRRPDPRLSIEDLQRTAFARLTEVPEPIGRMPGRCQANHWLHRRNFAPSISSGSRQKR